MVVETINNAEELKYLYDNWAMTWEGLVKEDFEKALDLCGGENAKGYLITGKTMNTICKLTGNNKYPENLNIFAIDKYKGLAINYGARWMTDIIDNNADREKYHPFR